MTEDRLPLDPAGRPGSNSAEARRARAAQALRENLRRRKARTTAQREETGSPRPKGPGRAAP